MAESALSEVEARAQVSAGASSEAIYRMVAQALSKECGSGQDFSLVDIGCGNGGLWPHVNSYIGSYTGIDIICYDGFPRHLPFIQHNLEVGDIPLAEAAIDIVVSVETIEHVENPRAFMRELTRLVKPGGWVVVTTPNQLSLLSKLTLLFKNQFNAFQDAPGQYPAHITALLEIDLYRTAAESGLENIKIYYSNQGRLPLTSWSWPSGLGFRGRSFSDNILCIGQKPIKV